ncbi:UDP-N-acetylmuramoyl-L-alanine--D-glutamate ligase [Lactobacillus agilis]|nr:UDP-N-acetylmuramoyl-L-alanine--D-glutamate ligase [Ligilactobacillus agilis]NJE32883.1 UDP-N-acetylmuramoyl-L-alanine--D-glutamate ligase [Ligilactobacillus agilis]
MKKITTYQGKKVLVLGLGKSGINAAELLAKLGAKVTVNDKNEPSDLNQVAALEAQNIKVVTGSHPLALLTDIDLMVKNPGIPYTNVLVAEAQKRGLKIITEPELAYEILEGQMIAITGTNGKTTTTTMITLMLNQASAKQHAYKAGNIGISASKQAQTLGQDDILVTELSSFQLLGISALHPHIAVLTNIYEAHTDYHGSRENYVKAKMRITMNQTAADYFVVNWDNPEWRELSKQSQAQVVPFSRNNLSQKGAYLKDGILYFRDEAIMAATDIKVPGTHNVENALAALAVAKLMGVPTTAIVEVLKTFSGVKHRTQYVRTINDRKFYNDSKATNMESTEKALAGFKQPVVLLAGGLDRGFTFEKLVPFFKDLRGLVVFGQTAELIAQAGEAAGVKHIIKTENAVTAVPLAYQLSQPGDIVLLSPACASWDQWKTFEDRGDKFIEAVTKLAQEVEEK